VGNAGTDATRSATHATSAGVFCDNDRDIGEETMSGQDLIGASGPRDAELELTRCARELEAARHELTETRRELERAREHLTLFAGQVGHDLRTPLTAVLAHAEMLAGESGVADDADLTWMVQGVLRAAHRLDRMIEEMVSYARHGGVVTRVDTDLGQLLEVVLADLAPLIDRTGAVVVVDELPTLAVDRQQLYAVLANLLSNALRFVRPDTNPSIRVSAERAGSRWRVAVTDNGVGVPSEQQETMFVLFARADKRSDGSGIGLATVKRVVEAHGGRVGMDSPVGGGTRVWFELPA